MKKLIILFVAYFYLTTAYCQTAREYIDMGLSKCDLGNLRGGIADFTKAIELNPNEQEHGYADSC